MAIPEGQLDAILLACLSNDNSIRLQAEEAVKAAAKQPALVGQLLERLGAASDPQVRQLAAVLLRKRITSAWQHLEPAERHAAQQLLLASIVAEPEAPVRRAVADVVSVVAKHTVPLGEWPGLLDFLGQCSAAPQAGHREVALVLFAALTETIGEQLRQHFAALQSVFLAGLLDSHHTVRLAALRAVAALVGWVATPEEVALFRELVPAVIQVAQHCLSAGEEDVAVQAFSIFTDLIEQPAPVLGPLLPGLAAFAMETALNTHYDLNTREQALQVITWLARYKPKQLAKGKQARAVVVALCQLCAEPVPADSDDASQLPARKFASQALDTLAINLPAKHVLPEVLSFAKAAAHSNSTDQQAAACLVVAVVAEGACEAVRKRINEVLQIPLAGLGANDEAVRGQAAFALGQLAEHCQPEAAEHHAAVVPPLLAALRRAATPAGQQQLCYALDTYCELLDSEEITPYLDELMKSLLTALASSEVETQVIALSGIASAASAAKDAFRPYASAVLPLLGRYMQATSDDMLAARARATECLGLVATALGRDAIAPVAPAYMEAALKGLELEYGELREYTHGMFANMAEVLGPDFAPYLAHVVPPAIAACTEAETAFSAPASRGVRKGGALGGISSDDETDSDEDEMERLRSLSIRTGVTDEKASAAHALGLYAEFCGPALVPHYESMLSALSVSVEYFHEGVRECGYASLGHLCIAAHSAAETGSISHAASQHITDAAFEAWQSALEDDEDKAAVTAAVEAAAAALKALGNGPCAAHAEKLVAAATPLLKGEAACQEVESDEEGEMEDDDEDGQEDEDLLSAVGELLPALAKALGGAVYAPSFMQQHLGPLLKQTRGSHPDGFRAIAVGCLAEVTDVLGPLCAPYAEALLSVVLKELAAAADDANCRNAAFCAGLLAIHAPTVVQPHLPRLLQELEPLFEGNQEPDTRDNAAGAVGRIISALGASLPLTHVVPVLLGVLPLEEDFDEAEPVYGALCGLVTGELAQQITSFVPDIIRAFGQVAVQEEVPVMVRVHVALTVAQLRHQHQHHIDPLLAALPAAQQHALRMLADQGCQ